MPAAELEVVRGSAAELQEQHQEDEYGLDGQDGFLQGRAGRVESGDPMVCKVYE